MEIVLAVLALCAVVSTPETRAAGREIVKPFARVAAIATVVIWAFIILFRRHH